MRYITRSTVSLCFRLCSCRCERIELPPRSKRRLRRFFVCCRVVSLRASFVSSLLLSARSCACGGQQQAEHSSHRARTKATRREEEKARRQPSGPRKRPSRGSPAEAQQQLGDGERGTKEGRVVFGRATRNTGANDIQPRHCCRPCVHDRAATADALSTIAVSDNGSPTPVGQEHKQRQLEPEHLLPPVNAIRVAPLRSLHQKEGELRPQRRQTVPSLDTAKRPRTNDSTNAEEDEHERRRQHQRVERWTHEGEEGESRIRSTTRRRRTTAMASTAHSQTRTRSRHADETLGAEHTEERAQHNRTRHKRRTGRRAST